MTDAIRDMLKMKDDPSVQNAKLSPVATMSREEAARHLFRHQEEKAYEIKIASKCILPCLTNMESASVSQKESDCMTNCTAKGMETYVWFRYLSLAKQ